MPKRIHSRAAPAASISLLSAALSAAADAWTSFDTAGSKSKNRRAGALAAVVGALVLLAPAADAAAAKACPAQELLGPPTTFATGDGPTHSTAGDFDRDGNLDVAFASFCDRSATVLLGDGEGGLAAPRSFAVGFLPATIVSGDFDGDRRLDLAVANSGDHDVSILLGDGHGDFERVGRTFAVGNSPRGMVAGDFNGDGRLDLAVANIGGAPFPLGCQNRPEPAEVVIMDLTEHRVAILLGDGRGGFVGEPGREATFVDAGPNPGRIAAGDLDGDADLDLAAANFSTGTVTVLSGDGRGSFARTATHRVGDTPLFVAVADLSGDRILDIATADNASSTVSVLLGLGDGGFAARRSFAVSGPRDLAVADLDSDHVPDLAVSHGRNVAVMLGKGGGDFGEEGDSDHFVDRPSGSDGGVEPVLAVPLDGDRRPDLVLGLAADDLLGSDNAAVLLNRCAREPGRNERQLELTSTTALVDP